MPLAKLCNECGRTFDISEPHYRVTIRKFGRNRHEHKEEELDFCVQCVEQNDDLSNVLENIEGILKL